MAAALTRTIASLGSSIRGSATSRTVSRLTSSKTTAFTSPLLLVDELGRNRLCQVDQLVRRLHVAHDRGEVALQLQLALHHPLHGIELLADHFLPPGVRRADDEPRLLALLGAQAVLPAAALAVPQVEPRPDVLRQAVVRLGLEDVRDVALPRRGRLLVLVRRIDPLDVELQPLLARELRHVSLLFVGGIQAPMLRGPPLPCEEQLRRPGERSRAGSGRLPPRDGRPRGWT